MESRRKLQQSKRIFGLGNRSFSPWEPCPNLGVFGWRAGKCLPPGVLLEPAPLSDISSQFSIGFLQDVFS